MTQLLQNAAYGTALILAAALLRRALKERLIPGARLALWGVCLFRLLTPAAPESVLSLWGLLAPEGQAAPAAIPAVAVPAAGASAAAPRPEPGIPWERALPALWLAVGVLLALRYALAWGRTRRAVGRAAPLDRGDPRYSPLPSFARLREGPMEGAPLTFGAVRPTVVLSPGLEGEELACVLAHEGVHAARRDNLWHYAMALALVVHWWNPAVWLMSRLLRRDIELSCDRAAVKKLGAGKRADYARALVSLSTQAEGPAFCQSFGQKATEERIRAVMKFKKISIIGVILTLALVLAVTIAFASEPKTPRDGLPEDVLQYAGVLHLGMSRSDVHRFLDVPSFSRSSPYYSDTYELDPDGHERQLCIYYDGDGTITQVKYFPDGTAANGTGIDLAPYLSSSAPDEYAAVQTASATDLAITADENGNVIKYAIDLEYLEGLLAQRVADGSMTQEEANCFLAQAQDFSEDGKALVWSFQGDSGLTMDEFRSIYYRDEDGNLFHVDPADVVGAFVFPDMPTYVEEPADPAREYFLEGEGDIQYDVEGYQVKLPTFDEDGSSVPADGGITGGGSYTLCGEDDCAVSGPHYHENGEVIMMAVPSAEPEPSSPVAAPDMDSDLIPAKATNGKIGYILESDTLEGQYGPVNNPEEAVKYMEWLSTQPSSYTIPVYDGAGNVIGEFPVDNSAASSPYAATYPVCTVNSCALTGLHTHNGTTYCGGAGHHGDTCDGSCANCAQPSGATGGHHSETHHSSGHH